MLRFHVPVIGRRGASLLFFGLIFAIFSWSYLAHPELITESPTKHVVNQLATPLQWGIVFAVVSALKCVAAFWKPLEWTAFGFGESIWFIWAASYLVEWLSGNAPYAYIGLAFYAGFAAFNVIIAGWPEDRTK